MEIYEVVNDIGIIGYRILEGDSTIDILKTKICTNMENYLKSNKTGLMHIQDSEVQTELYKILHKEYDLLVDLYQLFNLKVAQNTLYMKKGVVNILAEKEDGSYILDIITNNLELKHFLHSIEVLDIEDVNLKLEVITAYVPKDRLEQLKAYTTVIYCGSQEIIMYANKIPQKGISEINGFLYDVNSIEEILYRENLKIIELEG